MASRIFSRLRYVNRSNANLFTTSASSRFYKAAVPGLITVGFAIYKTEFGRRFPRLPVVAAAAHVKTIGEDPSPVPPRGGKMKGSVIPPPMASNTGAPCRSRKASDEGKPSQCNILSPMKEFSLFLWIVLKPAASPCNTMKAAANIQCLAEELNDCKCPEDNVIAGVGFGPNFWSQVMGKTCKNYYYTSRKGRHGEMPSTHGDIFVHAKCENKGKLFELCQNFLRSLPADSIEDFEDIYSFNYQDGRDFTGFIINQINPTDKNAKKEVAVECETGGSYCMTQKWVHDFCAIEEAGCKQLECYVGRGMECGEDNSSKSLSSHVARMNGGTEYRDPPPVEIVRQAQPYGHLSGDAGLFYIAFAKDPNSFEFLLDRMIGASCDGGHDDIMKVTCNVKGTYWYFPGMCELQQLKGDS